MGASWAWRARSTYESETGRPCGRPVSYSNRRRPTLPGPCGPSTIGAEGLNCSVRNGKRCGPLAIATESGETGPAPNLENCTVEDHAEAWMEDQNIRQALEALVPVCSAHCCAYTPGLSPGGLPGLLLPLGDGRAHLEVGFPLRCLQRLSRPDVANQQCPWQDNWYTRGPFVPVLSY